MDFHRVTNGTIAYIRKKYGEEFLEKIFQKTAQNVYRSIREDLLQGDMEQLIEHWTYFFDREGGGYAMEHKEDGVRMTVHRCPAIAHLQDKGVPVDPEFCRQTTAINQALAEGSPFEIETEVLGDGWCVQTIRRKP